MATVYSATHRNGNRVAIKLLRSSFARDPEVRARFLREGYVSNAVGHAGAVKVLDDDSSEGSVFLVMELLEGESLEARRRRLGGRLPVDEVFTVADKLLDVLASAHQHGIVHRDVKPENVFLTDQGEVKVLDFGVAQMRRAGGDKTGVGLMLGTPDFMAPEQMGGHPDEIDGRSDLWSVGSTLFFLLSGEAVHLASTLRDHIIATSTKQARSLAVAAPWVPVQLVDVIDRSLKLEKTDRWPDAGAMQTALRRAYAAISLARTSPHTRTGESGIPQLDDDVLAEGDKTQYQNARPWFASDVPPEPTPSSHPESSDRTLALPPTEPPPRSDRTIALTDTTERTAGAPNMSTAGPGPPPAKAAPPRPHPTAPTPASQPKAPAHFGEGVLRTERIANIAQLVAQVTARAAGAGPQGPPPPRAPQPSLPEIGPPQAYPSRAEPTDAGEVARQRVLIVAIVLVAAIVLAFAARLAFELRVPVQRAPSVPSAVAPPSAGPPSVIPVTSVTSVPPITPSASPSASAVSTAAPPRPSAPSMAPSARAD